MKVERRKRRLRRMMHSQERRYEMGNTLRYEGFRNVLLSQMRKDSRESWESNRFPEEKR